MQRQKKLWNMVCRLNFSQTLDCWLVRFLWLQTLIRLHILKHSCSHDWIHFPNPLAQTKNMGPLLKFFKSYVKCILSYVVIMKFHNFHLLRVLQRGIQEHLMFLISIHSWFFVFKKPNWPSYISEKKRYDVDDKMRSTIQIITINILVNFQNKANFTTWDFWTVGHFLAIKQK